MYRLIDADKLGLTDFEIVMCNGDYKEALKLVLSKIEDAPTVDAEPVIRCKDCKFYGQPYIRNRNCCHYYGGERDKNDYCSKGKLK